MRYHWCTDKMLYHWLTFKKTTNAWRETLRKSSIWTATTTSEMKFYIWRNKKIKRKRRSKMTEFITLCIVYGNSFEFASVRELEMVGRCLLPFDTVKKHEMLNSWKPRGFFIVKLCSFVTHTFTCMTLKCAHMHATLAKANGTHTQPFYYVLFIQMMIGANKRWRRIRT